MWQNEISRGIAWWTDWVIYLALREVSRVSTVIILHANAVSATLLYHMSIISNISWCDRRKGHGMLNQPLPWSSVHRLVQCTLECHWNATGSPSVHWDTTGPPSEYLQGTLEHHWKNLVETAPHWNATGETLHWNTIGGTVTAHTHPET